MNPVELIIPDWEDQGLGDLGVLRRFMNDYKYSSYFDYSVAPRPESIILAENGRPDFLREQNDIESLIEAYTKDRPL